MSQATQEMLEELGGFNCTKRRHINVPKIGNITTYWLEQQETWSLMMEKADSLKPRKISLPISNPKVVAVQFMDKP